jgi:hypothetical protein
VFDTASKQVTRTVKAGGGPDWITFLGDYALVRNSLTPDVTFVNLSNPELANEIRIGNQPVLSLPTPGIHARLFPNATGDEVLVPSPAGDQVYQIHLMVGEPMVMSQTKVNLGTDFVVPMVNQVLEVSPGLYQRVVRFEKEGSYTLTIRPSEDGAPLELPLSVVPPRVEAGWLVQPVASSQEHSAGQEVSVRYQVTRRATGEPETDIKDGVITLYRLVPGQAPWQRVLPVSHEGNGVYGARLQFSEAGDFTMTFSSRGLGLTVRDQPPATVRVGTQSR